MSTLAFARLNYALRDAQKVCTQTQVGTILSTADLIPWKVEQTFWVTVISMIFFVTEEWQFVQNLSVLMNE